MVREGNNPLFINYLFIYLYYISICCIRGLQAKLKELECLVLNDNLDIVVISETCWNGKNQWDTVIPGYILYRQDWEGICWGRYCIV